MTQSTEELAASLTRASRMARGEPEPPLTAAEEAVLRRLAKETPELRAALNEKVTMLNDLLERKKRPLLSELAKAPIFTAAGRTGPDGVHGPSRATLREVCDYLADNADALITALTPFKARP